MTDKLMQTLRRLGLVDEPEVEDTYCCPLCDGGWGYWDDEEEE